MCGRDNLAIGVISVDQIAAHEEIWTLEVIPGEEAKKERKKR